MSTCKECKYFEKSKGKKVGGYFNPQPFGPKQTNPAQQGSCHLNPPSVNGQHLVVSENDWCGHFAPNTLEAALNETADELIE